MSNMAIWDKLCKTDPKHTKTFQRAGGFKGTAIRPLSVIEKLTEMFGPAGDGWGTTEPKFQLVPSGDEILVYCTLGLWYMADNTRSDTIYGIGGDKVVSATKNGPRADDEAFKKAFTDALMNCGKHLGVSADVHMGLFDDSKYVAQMAEEFSAPSFVTEERKEKLKGWWVAQNISDMPKDLSGKLEGELTDKQFSGLYDQLKALASERKGGK